MKFYFSLLLTILCFTYNIHAQISKGVKQLNNQSHLGKTLIENKGQWPNGVVFRANMDGGKLWMLENKMIFHLQDYSSMHKAHAMSTPGFTGETIKETLVHLNFVGSKKAIEIKKNNPSDFYYNYFIGSDQSKWASDVHGFESAVFKEFYSGIDFKITGQGDEVKYEFVVHPKNNPSVIKLNYAGHNGLRVDKKGNLVIDTDLGKIIENKPYAYQIIEGKKKEVTCKFNIEGDNVTFDLGKYNINFELVIDPVLVFSTYNGASSDNFGMTATYGHDGSAYSGGIVYGNNFPIPDSLTYDITSNFNVIAGSYGVTDVFITKFNATGTQMLWSTFIGGGDNIEGTETVHSMICDLNDNLYFFGATSSIDFPTTANSFNQTHNGGSIAQFFFNGVYYSNQGTDIFVSKLSTDGYNLLGSTLVGGSGNDGVNYTDASLPYNSVNAYSGLISNYGDQFRGEIMLDQNNNILIASCTKSNDFPTANAVQGTNGGQQDGVVFKLAANFQSLLFSSYYGGTDDDACYSLKVDGFDNIIFAGGTKSNNLIATTGGWQTTFAGGTTDGFVVKLPPTGNNITQASYIGRNQYDQVFFVEVDRDDNIFLLGQSVGGTFPIVNAPFSNGNSSNFIIKLNPSLNTNMASTRFGNGSTSIHISPAAFLVDVCGNIYVSAWGANILQSTGLNGMPVTPDAFRLTPPNGFDFYLLVIERNFGGILYGTYIGGNQSQEHVDGGTSRFDKNGIVYQSVCAGCGSYDDFPTTPGAWSAINNSSNCNNAIYKFDTGVIPNAEFTTDQVIGCQNFTVNFNNISSEDDTFIWDFGNGVVDSITFNPTVTFEIPGTYQVNLYVKDSFCLIVDTAQITITVIDSIIIDLPDTLKLCNSLPSQLTVNSYGTGDYFIWSSSPNFTNPLNIPTDSSIIVSPPEAKYYIKVGNQYCDKIDSVVVVFDVPPIAEITLNNQQGCSPLTITLTNSSIQTSYFLWDFDNGSLDSINVTTSVTYSVPGSYQIILTIVDDDCLVNDSDTVIIDVFPSIVISLVDTISLCTSVPINFNPTISGGASEFIWSTSNQFNDTLNNDLSQAEITINDPVTGYYYFHATNGNCENIDSVYVEFTSASLSLIGDNLICLGETTNIIATSNDPNITFIHSWSPSSIIVNPTTNNIVQVNPSTSQYLYLDANSSNGCFIQDSIYISVSTIDPANVVASTSQTIVSPGTTVVLSGNPSGMNSYSWTPTLGLATPNTQSTNALVNETTIFTLTVSDGICDVSDTVEVKVYTIICEDPYVFIPNAFTPNGDNYNDVLYVRGIWIEKMIFRVFDRWGEMVFESTDPNIGWDGVFRGKKLDPDVYDYYLDVTCIGGLQSITKGNVTLMK